MDDSTVIKQIPLLLISIALLAAAPASGPSVEQRCADVLADWNARFAAEHFESVVAPPFVIAGDGGRRKIERYRDGTILAAQRALQATFFTRQPQQPILILLFESEEPYRRLARQWFNERDVPHFGFFRSDNVMLMNVGTGTGTLVHELAHALMRPDFPDAPGWFNEGLASLYEQCTLDGDRITGLKNWRLPALRKAIEEKTLRPLRELIEDPNFYSEQHVGLNYAQARYLMMYLQEKNQLQTYYRQFRDGHADDPSGLKTLEKLVAPLTVDEFDRAWRQWVLAL